MVDKISGIADFELWRLGVPLRDAPATFGMTAAIPKIIREARRDARETAELGKRKAREAGLDWDASYDALGKLLSYTSESSGVSTARMQRLVQRLEEGDLVAVGFSVTATANEPPEVVPLHLLERRFFDLNKGEVKSEHFHFRQVRIALREAVKGGALPPEQAVKTRGPKSVGDIVRQTYHSLIQSGDISQNHTVKAAWNIALPHLRRDNPDLFKGGRGLSYPSFARHIKAK
jgi:hypothetical protein